MYKEDIGTGTMGFRNVYGSQDYRVVKDLFSGVLDRQY